MYVPLVLEMELEQYFYKLEKQNLYAILFLISFRLTVLAS